MDVRARPGTADRPLQEHPERRGSPRPLDLVLAALCAALALASLFGHIEPIGEVEDRESARTADALGTGLVLLGCAAVAAVRARLLAALVVVDGSFFLVHALGYLAPPLPAAEVVVLFVIASTRRTAVAIAAVVVTTLSIFAADWLNEPTLDDDKLTAYLISVVAACVFGYVVQASRVQARTAQQNVRLLTGQREALTELAVQAEKERISRELHDIVGFSVGVMVAQASAARLVADEQPEAARAALQTIEGVGRSALGEMRVLVQILNDDQHAIGDDGVHDQAEGIDEDGPPGTLASLPTLIRRTEAGGLEVDLLVKGEARPVPPMVDRAAYRIVQESLTNCLKHAGPARVSVVVTYQDNTLDLQVRDNGTARPSGGEGNGRRGMQQRVRMLGGAFHAGLTPDGFEVSASLPTGRS